MPASMFEAARSEDSTAHGRILLVDDEPELRRLLRRALVRAGYEVVEATNGSAALAIARREQFDAVFTDVRMPTMGGLELLRLLLSEDPALPVVLMSGSAELGNRRSAVDVGAFDYLPKPISLSRLQSVASSAVAQHAHALSSEEGASDARDSYERVRVAAPVAASGQ